MDFLLHQWRRRECAGNTVENDTSLRFLNSESLASSPLWLYFQFKGEAVLGTSPPFLCAVLPGPTSMARATRVAHNANHLTLGLPELTLRCLVAKR